MPKKMIDALTDFVEKRALEFVPLKDNCITRVAQARLAKYLGKYSFLFSADRAAARTPCLSSDCVIAVFFQLQTGCRPREAAFLILSKESF